MFKIWLQVPNLTSSCKTFVSIKPGRLAQNGTNLGLFLWLFVPFYANQAQFRPICEISATRIIVQAKKSFVLYQCLLFLIWSSMEILISFNMTTELFVIIAQDRCFRLLQYNMVKLKTFKPNLLDVPKDISRPEFFFIFVF